MKQLKYNSDMIARLSDLLFRISNDVRGVGKYDSMVHTQLEQVAKSQRELLDEMNNNIHDFAVRVATRGGKVTQEPFYHERHPKRIEQDSQRIKTDAPSPSKKKRKMIGLCIPLVNLKLKNLLKITMMSLSLMLKL